MNNKSLKTVQFFKDGLPGAILVALIYLPLWLVMPSPGVFFVIAMFICTGLTTHFINQNIPTRKDWAKPILKMLGIAWLMTLITTPLYFVLLSIIGNLVRLAEHHNFHHSLSEAFFAVYEAVAQGFSLFTPAPGPINLYLYSLYIIGSMIGLLVGFVISYLAASLFYSQKQWTHMFIPVIANFFVIISIYLSTVIFLIPIFG